ncbi:MAG: VOC family protein [Myxococcota bacterium]
MRIRQIALVARQLEPVVASLERVLGIEVCFRDPEIGVFGLENAVFPVGDTFLEVVSPLRPDASAARLLERRRGDGGYMVILQCEDLQKQRRRLEELGVRVVWETAFPDIATVHLHPRDVGAAILSFDEARPPGSWRWAGPDWESRVRTGVVTGIAGAELQSPDPAALAERWSQVLAHPARPLPGAAHEIELEGGRLRFVAESDGRGEGLSGLALRVVDPARPLAAARELGLPLFDDEVEICGTRMRFV